MIKARLRTASILSVLLLVIAFGCGRVVETATLSGSLEIRDGFYVLHLWGSPQEMGRAHGTLLKNQISELIQKYLYEGVLNDFGIPWPFLVLEAKKFEAALPQDFKTELHAIAEGAGISYDEILVGQLIVDLAAYGSTSFVAKGGATAAEAVIQGSNIEWTDYNNSLRDNLVIIYYEPDEGNKFVSLSYAGGAGVLIGMNEKQIASSITVIDAGYNPPGLAAAANLRRMLQYGDNLDQAAASLIADDRTRGYTVPLSCGSPEGILVMELSPYHYYTREAESTFEALVSANHFISSEMLPYQDSSSAESLARYARLMELVSGNYGSITASLAKIFMSDQTGTHPINSNLVIYSTVLLPKDLSFWVSKGPVSSEAAYVSFSLE